MSKSGHDDRTNSAPAQLATLSVSLRNLVSNVNDHSLSVDYYSVNPPCIRRVYLNFVTE